MHPRGAGPPVSGIASCIPSRVARTTPLDELTVASRTTLFASFASACQIATQTPATPEAGPPGSRPQRRSDDFSVEIIAAFA